MFGRCAGDGTVRPAVCSGAVVGGEEWETEGRRYLARYGEEGCLQADQLSTKLHKMFPARLRSVTDDRRRAGLVCGCV